MTLVSKFYSNPSAYPRKQARIKKAFILGGTGGVLSQSALQGTLAALYPLIRFFLKFSHFLSLFQLVTKLELGIVIQIKVSQYTTLVAGDVRGGSEVLETDTVVTVLFRFLLCQVIITSPKVSRSKNTLSKYISIYTIFCPKMW